MHGNYRQSNKVDSKDRRTKKLLNILYKRDDELMSIFCQALVDTGQAHVARMLGFKG